MIGSMAMIRPLSSSLPFFLISSSSILSKEVYPTVRPEQRAARANSSTMLRQQPANSIQVVTWAGYQGRGQLGLGGLARTVLRRRMEVKRSKCCRLSRMCNWQEIRGIMMDTGYKQQIKRMYHNRYQPFYTAYYTQIPYLDSEIRGIENMRQNESGLRYNRFNRTAAGLAATAQKANILDHELARSRRDDYRQDHDLHRGLAYTTQVAQERGVAHWNDFSARRNWERAQDHNAVNHLASRLADNRSRSLERLSQVRRWI